MAVVQTKNKTEEKVAAKTVEKPVATLKLKELVVKARFLRNSPDKVRFVGKALIGMKLQEAIDKAGFISKESAKDIEGVLKNALAIAKDKDMDENNLYIKTIAVLEGPKLKRRRIVHRGRATSILKRMSHLSIYLTDKPLKQRKDKNGS